MKKLYVDYAGGKFESWMYKRGQRKFMNFGTTWYQIECAASYRNFKLVLTAEAKLFASMESN